MYANARIPATRNEGWGFHGTMEVHAQAAWPLAMAAIAKATGEQPEAVRAFLDSAPGRHFADEVHNGMRKGRDLAAAIDAATQTWMGWKISASVNRRYGIPRHLPCLTVFVAHCEMTSNDE